MTKQLVLPVALKKHVGFESFIDGENNILVGHLKDVIRNGHCSYPSTSQRISVFVGYNGTGKTHLLLASCEYAQRLNLNYQFIDLAKIIEMPTDILSGMTSADVVCIDNLQNVEDNPQWQRAVFDVINQFIEYDRRMLIFSCSKAVNDMEYSLLDLQTRLNWGINFNIKPLNDEDKLAALKKQLDLRSIPINDDALSFMLKRVSRNMHELSTIIAAIDEETLSSKRKVTIPFIKQTLSI